MGIIGEPILVVLGLISFWVVFGWVGINFVGCRSGDDGKETYSLNSAPRRMGLSSISRFGPASRFIRESWVQPRKAQGLLKS